MGRWVHLEPPGSAVPNGTWPLAVFDPARPGPAGDPVHGADGRQVGRVHDGYSQGRQPHVAWKVSAPGRSRPRAGRPADGGRSHFDHNYTHGCPANDQ